MKTDPYLSPFIKLNSKRIKAHTIRKDSLNLIAEKLGNNIDLTGTEKYVLNRTHMV